MSPAAPAPRARPPATAQPVPVTPPAWRRAPPDTPQLSSWRGSLSLAFAVGRGRTIIGARRHAGPLQVQRPFWPGPDGRCHVYLLHPPGGVVGGDELSIEAQAAADAQALLTTPAATKFYRSRGPWALQDTALHVATGATLEWLPQETLIHPGARAETRLRVGLEPGARFFGWEIVGLGLPASGQPFAADPAGEFRQVLELWRGDEPLFVERAHLTAAHPALEAPWGLAGRTVWGTLIAHPVPEDGIAAVRERMTWVGAGQGDGIECTVTALPGVVVARVLAAQTAAARECLARVWEALRPLVAGSPARRPRIWST